MVDILFECLDALETYVNTVSLSGQEGNEEFQSVLDALANILGTNKGKKKTASIENKEENPTEEFKPVSEKLRVEFNQYDANVIRKAFEADMNVFEIHVELDQGCLLKAARAFIVFQILEKMRMLSSRFQGGRYRR